MGRAEEAEPLVRSALGSAPRDTDLAQNAAWLLAESLEGQGRSDEAAEVRKEYGLD